MSSAQRLLLAPAGSEISFFGGTFRELTIRRSEGRF
jgi:hypothetical protein